MQKSDVATFHRQFSAWLIQSIAVLYLIGFAAGCGKNSASAPHAMPPVPVMVAKAVQKTVPDQLQEVGTVEAYATVNIKSRAEGELIKIGFKEGDFVNKGQLLFQLDPRPLEAAVSQARANLAKDQASAQQAVADARRYTFLMRQGVGSRQQSDQAEATAAAATATVEADQAALKTAELNLQYAEIRSPINGHTGNLQVHIGDLIKSDADTAMVTITQIQPIYVDFSIPEARLAQVREGMEKGPLKVDATIPNSQMGAEHGVLSFINNTVDSTTGTILLKGLFQNENRRLWPGTFVNVSLTVAQIPHAILVPASAVQTGQEGKYVFTVGSDMKAQMQPVTAGIQIGTDIVLEKGVAAGQTVVTDGQLRLTPGATVVLKQAL